MFDTLINRVVAKINNVFQLVVKQTTTVVCDLLQTYWSLHSDFSCEERIMMHRVVKFLYFGPF